MRNHFPITIFQTLKYRDQPVNQNIQVSYLLKTLYFQGMLAKKQRGWKEIKTHTRHVCLLVNWENTKNNWFLVDFLFFNHNKSRLQIHLVKSYLYKQLMLQSAPAFTTQPGSSQPLYRCPEMTFNAERKINNPARTKNFKSNNFNLEISVH